MLTRPNEIDPFQSGRAMVSLLLHPQLLFRADPIVEVATVAAPALEELLIRAETDVFLARFRAHRQRLGVCCLVRLSRGNGALHFVDRELILELISRYWTAG